MASDEDITKEIQAHLAMEIEHRQRQGMSAEEARRTAMRDFGGVEKYREETREAHQAAFWDVLKQDVRFGVRSLRRSPGYLIAAVVILALGIGANTAMFSVIRGVLLKPLPFRDQSRLVLVQQSAPGSNAATVNVSLPEYYDYRERVKSVRDLVEYHQMNFVMLKRGDPARVNTGVVSPNFFAALGVKPLLGRDFTDADAQLGAPAALMLTYEYWKSKFDGDPSVVNTAVEMNNAVNTIIGVLPPYPQYPQTNDIYMPTSACPFRASAQRQMASSHRVFGILSVFGWLRDGVSKQQAGSEIKSVAESFAADYPQNYRRAVGFTGRVALLSEELVADARPRVLALGAATLLVLIIACANVANLAIARNVQRSRELAVRTALGADRVRLVRQLVTESMLVAGLSAAIGIGLAQGSLAALIPFIGRFTSRTGQISIDGGVLAFTLLATLATAVICGLAPALGMRRNLITSMRDGLQGGESPARQRVRAGLVVAQVVVSFVLLIGASLLLTSVYRMSAVPRGYDTEKVISAAVFGNFTSLSTPAQQTVFMESVLSRLRSEPGVVNAAMTNAVPLAQGSAPGLAPFSITGGGAADQTSQLQADGNAASGGYFETLGVPLVRGRAIQDSDTTSSAKVTVINQTMAKLWRGQDPIGTYVVLPAAPNAPAGTPGTEWLVIGVVADFRLYGAQDITPQYFVPLKQAGGFGGRVLVRGAGDPHVLGDVIRKAVHAVDNTIPVAEVQTLAELKTEELSSPALTAGLLAAFAIVALVITLAGITGLIGNAVMQRTREFGVRLALGARPWSIVWSVLMNGLLLVGVGVVLGTVFAYSFSQALQSFLYATKPTDAGAYAAVAGVFLLAAAIAAFAPAKRIVAIDPLKVLRTE